MPLNRTKLQDNDFKELHRRNPAGTQHLLEDIMNHDQKPVIEGRREIFMWCLVGLAIFLFIARYVIKLF